MCVCVCVYLHVTDLLNVGCVNMLMSRNDIGMNSRAKSVRVCVRECVRVCVAYMSFL